MVATPRYEGRLSASIMRHFRLMCAGILNCAGPCYTNRRCEEAGKLVARIKFYNADETPRN